MKNLIKRYYIVYKDGTFSVWLYETIHDAINDNIAANIDHIQSVWLSSIDLNA